MSGTGNVRFIGGGRWPSLFGNGWKGANATMPLVECLIGDGRVRVGLRWGFARRVFSFMAPTVDLALGAVTAAPIRAIFSEGVRITGPDGKGVIFWTSSRQAVIDALVAGGARLGEPDRLRL